MVRKLRAKCVAFWREEDGPSATEYAIMLALIVLIAMSAIRGIGEGMEGVYQSIEGAIPSVSGG